MYNLNKIVEHFLNTNEKKVFGNFATNGNVLSYIKPYVTLDPTGVQKTKVELVAIKTKSGMTVGNSSTLRLIESKFGRANRSETEIQRLLAEKIPMLPFSVFQTAKLDLNELQIIESGAPEKIDRYKLDAWGQVILNKNEQKEIETVHFTGAKLFKVNSQVFLFDVDRNELKHKIFNPFLVELVDKTVKTIKQAYESLKPQTVKDAESKGLTVKRQGEWFFIPVELTETFVKEHRKKVENWQNKLVYPEMILQAGNNRPNYAKTGFKAFDVNYIKGLVRHSGREHNDLELTGWHIAVPNTSITSWQISGDID